MVKCVFTYFKQLNKVQITTIFVEKEKLFSIDKVKSKENKNEAVFTLFSNIEDFSTIEEIVKKEAYVYFFNKGVKGETACNKILGYLKS
jgi:hypothetical protein